MSELKGVLKAHDFQQNLVGNMFLNAPEGNFCRIDIFGEISHLTNFVEEDLYVNYEFYIPPGYKQDNENDYYLINKQQHLDEDLSIKLKSITQISSCYINPHSFSFTKPGNFQFRHVSNNYKENEDEFLQTNYCLFHNFCHPFDIELLGHYDAMSVFNPKMLFQINKVDHIGIHRVEGYSFVSIPMKTGFHSFNVPCYKPQEDLYLKEFSYFLGGSRTIPDLIEIIKTSSVNENNIEVALNRYGIKTEYAGDLCVNVNVVIQDGRIAYKAKKVVKEKKGLEDYNFVKGIETAAGEKFFDYKEKNQQMQTTQFGQINRQGGI